MRINKNIDTSEFVKSLKKNANKEKHAINRERRLNFK